MSGSWDAMLTDEDAAKQIRADHESTFSKWMRRRREVVARRFSWVLWQKGYTSGWWDAVEWLRHEQMQWESLTAGESIIELRKGPGSIYFPLFSEDPAINADCPGMGGHRTVVDAEGVCPECAYDFEREM